MDASGTKIIFPLVFDINRIYLDFLKALIFKLWIKPNLELKITRHPITIMTSNIIVCTKFSMSRQVDTVVVNIPDYYNVYNGVIVYNEVSTPPILTNDPLFTEFTYIFPQENHQFFACDGKLFSVFWSR